MRKLMYRMFALVLTAGIAVGCASCGTAKAGVKVQEKSSGDIKEMAADGKKQEAEKPVDADTQKKEEQTVQRERLESEKKEKAKKETQSKAVTKNDGDGEKTDLRTAFVGDSILNSFNDYKLVEEENRKVIAKIGVSPYTFYNDSIMDELLDYRAERMFFMLGMNSIEGNPPKTQIDRNIEYYEKIIGDCMAQNKKLEVVVLSVSPVRPKAAAQNTVIRAFNRQLKTMADKLGVEYYDINRELSDGDGNLKSEYADADGEHPNKAGCEKMLELLSGWRS